MSVLWWIVTSGLAMAGIALVGSLTLLLKGSTLKRLVLPLVAFAAGSLIGGALFHMLPAVLQGGVRPVTALLWLALGFTCFFLLEQFLHYHHCATAEAPCKEPLTYLILIGDGLHNFLGGLAVAGTFILDIRLGITTWIAAAAHEIPQELGDFAVLVHGGWRPRSALAFNVLSASTFLVGGLAAYFASFHGDIWFLVPFAAGNFLYIGASDLVPEVNKHSDPWRNLEHFVAFVTGMALLLVLKLAAEPR